MIILRNKYFGGKVIGRVASESGLNRTLLELFAREKPIIQKAPKNIPPKWQPWASL